jgi:4a-hydroxytetrahydrobiopterin dehydratase
MASRERLTDNDLTTALQAVPDWHSVGNSIGKTFEFSSYGHAVLFTGAVAHLAERMDHHPEILLKWGAVTVTTWTHDAGGVTGVDIELAKRIEAL